MQQSDKEKLIELIEDVEICMLTTIDGNGTLRSRPMATQRDFSENCLWFFTASKGGKIDEIVDHPQVNLAYSSPSQQKYISVSGRASLVQDRKKMAELWKPSYTAWFPEGLEDPEIGLLKVEIQRAEVWDSPSSAVAHLFGFTKAMITGESYSPGGHRRFNGETEIRH